MSQDSVCLGLLGRQNKDQVELKDKMQKDRTGKDKMGNRVGQSSRGQNQQNIVWGPGGGGRTSDNMAWIILFYII